MANSLEEFIILTPLTCVEQCNALMKATSAKTSPCYLLISIFGVYCGLVAYRSYRSYIDKTEKSQEPAPRPVDEIPDLQVSLAHELEELLPQLMVESLNYSDNSWCYYSELTTPSMVLGRTAEILDSEQDDNKASTSKSVATHGAMVHRPCDDN
ncbi:uncharacterized protein LOC117592310 [Drosophila guanche]|uniref:uncharacterized protein LOC117592310 n=1 Tax=Drosophila guanche TaxID=7266 RepID=UPI0014723A6F|nr:uncharacterized protein LOC117592310 [Drosophila guanche]XP_034141876.1 uncharacterized protein LOC117592310 [Drosophila guanche]